MMGPNMLTSLFTPHLAKNKLLDSFAIALPGFGINDIYDS
jgi:hypothetical protein